MNDTATIAADSAPADASALSQEVVVATRDAVTLHGTLQRLQRPTAVPAMLLLQGSGPVDRDGNIPGKFETDVQKQIAETLARAGVASLRCDKRGEYANKDELPQDTEEVALFLAWDNLVQDAVAAWRFLRDQPGIDPKRVGFFGHSEGGIVALAASHALLDAGENPAALVLAATPGRPMGEIVHAQIEQLMAQRGVQPAKAKAVLDKMDEIQEDIAVAGEIPAQVPPLLQPLYKPELVPYWQALQNLDPAELAKLFPGPVLIIEGVADKQVSARDDAMKLDEALSERPSDDHDLVIVPKVDHELKPVTDKNGAGETGQIEPTLVRDISAWVTAKLIDQTVL